MAKSCFYKRVKVNRFSGSGYIPRFQLKLSKEQLNGALHNDLVLFRLPESGRVNFKRKNRFNSFNKGPEVIKVLERFKTEFVVEVLQVGENSLSVFFDDPLIPNKREVFGNFRELERGEKIVIKLYSFPPKRLQGNLIKRLGRKDEKGIDYLSLVHDLNLPEKFLGAELEEEIRKLEEKRETVLTNLELYESLEDKAFVTIDGKDAKDFDDAIYVERAKQGYRVYVAIADVWAYLKHCPNIFLEATKRGTSIYLLDRVISMLPPILSEDLCSLRENEKRNTLCISIELDISGEPILQTERIFPAFIRSRKRFTYETLNQYFSKQLGENIFPSKEVRESLLLSYELVSNLMKKERSANKEPLSIHQSKYEYLLDSAGEIKGLHLNHSSTDLTFQKIIERLMILANSTVAKWFTKQNEKTVYRVHKFPELPKIQNFLKEIGPLCLINPPFFSTQEEITTQSLNKLLKELSSSKNFKLIQHNLLLSLPKAEYSVCNIGHFGLNAQDYLHFTSPIRRIADLLVHKSLWMELLSAVTYSHEEREEHKGSLDRLAYLANLSEQRGVTAERRYLSQKLYKYLLLKNQNNHFEGVVTLRTEWGCMLKVDQYYDGFIKKENLKGEKHLGEKIKVKKIEHSWDEFAEF